MKKNVIAGLISLLLLSVLLGFALTAVNSFRNDTAFEMGGVVHTAGLTLCILFAAMLFFASKGRRLRVALLIVAGGAGGVLLAGLQWPLWKEFLLAGGLFLLYLAGCLLLNQRSYGKGIRMLNAAVEAYQKDHDGEAFLSALDNCETFFPSSATVRSQEAGLITFREHLACERLRVLNEMGRLDERRALLEQLRQEAKSPDFLNWLENQN